MYFALNRESFKPHHTLPSFMHHMLIFGHNHTSLVNMLCQSVIVISGWSTVNTYHVTKSMGTGSDQLRNSFGRNNTMGCLKGTSPFTSKILKSILFTVCHTSVIKISLRIWCSIKWYPLVWWFLSSHHIAAQLTVNWYYCEKLENWSLLRVQILSLIQSSTYLMIIP